MFDSLGRRTMGFSQPEPEGSRRASRSRGATVGSNNETLDHLLSISCIHRMGPDGTRRNPRIHGVQTHFPMMEKPTEIVGVAAPWQDVVMLCGKCSRKLDGGFGKKGKHDLKDVLRDALKAAGRRRALRVVEVGCLGLCPKRAVTAVSSAHPTEVLAIPARTGAEAVLARLNPQAASAP